MGPVAPVGPEGPVIPEGPVAPKFAALPGGPVGPVSMPTNPQGAGWAPTSTGSTKRLIFFFIHTSLCEQGHATFSHCYDPEGKSREPTFVDLVCNHVGDFDAEQVPRSGADTCQNVVRELFQIEADRERFLLEGVSRDVRRVAQSLGQQVVVLCHRAHGTWIWKVHRAYAEAHLRNGLVFQAGHVRGVPDARKRPWADELGATRPRLSKG